MTPADLLRHGIVGKAAYPHWAWVVCVPLIIGFVSAIIACCVIETVPMRVMLIVAILIDVMILMALGTTARCRMCSESVTWFSVRLGREDALTMLALARQRGVRLRLPYAGFDRSSERFDVAGFACERCRLLHVGSISDPDAPTGS